MPIVGGAFFDIKESCILGLGPDGHFYALQKIYHCYVFLFFFFLLPHHEFAIRSQDFPSALVFHAGTLVCVVHT